MKKMNYLRILIIGVFLLPFLAACKMPAAPTPQETEEAKSITEPEITLTALFALLETSQAEQTEAVPTAIILPSNTPAIVPTDTAAAQELVATATTAPTATLPPTLAPTLAPTSAPATAAPTATAGPVSYKGPGKRNGPSIVAPYLTREPTIDGVFDEWDVDRTTMDHVVFGANRWSGLEDLSGSMMVGWDDYNLYIAARVRDDVFAQSSSGELIFRGDSLGLLLDMKVSDDFHQRELSRDDYQIGLSAGSLDGGKAPESYIWYPKSKAGSYIEIKIATTATDNGYRLEAKIPWEILGVKPDIGMHFGLALAFSDNDRKGEKIQQSMVSNVRGRKLTDPTTWGDLTLAGKK